MPKNEIQWLAVSAVMMTACGSPQADTTAMGSTGDSGTGAGTSGTSESTGETGTPTTGPGPGTTTTTGDATTTTGTTTTGDATTTTTDGETSTGDGTTVDTDAVCDPDAVLDAVSYNYVKTTDVGVEGVTAGYYNLAAGELVFLAETGLGVRMALDGTVLGDVAAPLAISGDLDGAVYDAKTETALLIDQECNLAEVDPVTLAELGVEAIDTVQFDLDFCSGIALGTDGNLYVASLATDEVVVISRDLTQEVDRFNVQTIGINAIDGIALIPGSELFLVHSNMMPAAAIVAANGDVVVPASDIGGAMGPLIGGVMPTSPDALFTVCANGQVWLCGGLMAMDCYKYAPEGGGEDVCGCLTGR